MERYIQQLAEDLRDAKRFVPKRKPQEEIDEDDFMEGLYEIDRIIDNREDSPMHNIFGIDPISFPPANRLTPDQASFIASEILELWEAFNIEAVYPQNFPLDKLYPMLVEKFKKPFMYFPMGTTGIEFCNYDPDECPFGDDYCTCKDYVDDWEKESLEIEKDLKKRGIDD